MRALCYTGVGSLAVETMPDPAIVNPRDAIVRVKLSSVCGSDLHFIDGYLPTMKKGDILGHEFLGEIVEVGAEVKKLEKGDRVIVSPMIGCGRCAYCRNGEWGLCDNSNPNHVLTDELYGDTIAGVFGCSHAFGGYPGSHAEYVRVPFADHGCFPVPDEIADESALFVSDALPTGYMGADLANIRPGDVVAVWGAGGVGLMAMHSARILGAGRVIAVDRVPERLRLAEEHAGAEPLNLDEVDVLDALRELTGGRGPDACIDAVGMEADGVGVERTYDRVKQALRLETDRPPVLRQCIRACRKGGTVSIMGLYGGFIDKFPIGAAMIKGLNLRMGVMHAQRYIPKLLEHVQRGDVDPAYLATHRMRLDEGPRGYEIFRNKREGCVRAVFAP